MLRYAPKRGLGTAATDSALTLPQFTVLTMLMTYPGASGVDLARVSLLTPQTVSVIVANLERNGAIERHAHAVHGRIQRIAVTASGKQRLVACHSKVKLVEDELLSGLSPQRKKSFASGWCVSLTRSDPLSYCGMRRDGLTLAET